MCDFSKAWRENRNVIMENRANLLKSLGESLRNTAYFEITRNLHFYHGIRQKISVTLLEWYFNCRRQTIWKEKSCSIRNRSYYKRINQRKEKSVSTKQTSCSCKSLTTWAQHRVSLLIELLSQAQKVLQDLSQSYYSANSLHLKKGILLALAAAAIGFGKEAKPFLTGKFFTFSMPEFSNER